jgi:large subunit ribosomal protein L15
MNLKDLKPAAGSRHRRKIVGRGRGSGHGATATRGSKGQNSRSGGTKGPSFEGGQMPIMRRVPKRGFTNIFKKSFSIINLDLLDTSFASGAEVNKSVLMEKGLIDNVKLPLKVLGNGELTKPLKITAEKFSDSAAEKIKKAGGEAIKAIKAVSRKS